MKKHFSVKSKIATGSLLSVSLFLGMSGVAVADSFDVSLDTEEIAASVAEANGDANIDVSLDVDMVETSRGVEVVTSEVDAQVLDDSEGVAIAVSSETDTPAHTMLLPDAAEDITVEDGIAIVDPETMDNVQFAVSASDEGAVRVYCVLEGKNSPERYDYEFPEADFMFSDEETGAVYIAKFVDEDVEIIGVLEAPWAVDANGVSVPTYFEMNGTTLTQVVEHISGDFAYPVVADPDWWDNVKGWFAKAGTWVKNKAYSAARWLGKNSRWLAGKAWVGVKWTAGKGKILAKRTAPGFAVVCAVGGGWAWYRSDATGIVRVGDAVVGCFS